MYNKSQLVVWNFENTPKSQQKHFTSAMFHLSWLKLLIRVNPVWLKLTTNNLNLGALKHLYGLGGFKFEEVISREVPLLMSRDIYSPDEITEPKWELDVVKSREWPLFKAFYNLSEVSAVPAPVVHANYALLFLSNSRMGVRVTNTHGLYRRWQHTSTFLFNLVYFDTRHIVFGNSIFKQELRMLNWHTFTPHTSLFRRVEPYFYFDVTKRSNFTELLMDLVVDSNFRTLFMLDVAEASTMLSYLRKRNVFSIGLVGANVDPWVVDFPVLLPSNNLFTQYFFLKFLFFMKQSASRSRFTELKKLWLSAF